MLNGVAFVITASRWKNAHLCALIMEFGSGLRGWIFFIFLSFIWGSSFILMKEGMEVLSPYQVASLRILSAGVLLLPFALKAFRRIPANKRLLSFLSGFIGSLIPAYLFCIAETEIDSSLAGILNATTPVFTIIMGALFFKLKTTKQKLFGVVVGFIGMLLLPFAGGKEVTIDHLFHTSLVLIATILYGTNVNMVGKYLHHIESIDIASFAFVSLLPLALGILYSTGYFTMMAEMGGEKEFLLSTLASCTLGAVGTALATILFYKMLKTSGVLMASLVTYGIPFFAIMWGLIVGESINLMEIGCLFIILVGVYLVNKKPVNKVAGIEKA